MVFIKPILALSLAALALAAPPTQPRQRGNILDGDTGGPLNLLNDVLADPADVPGEAANVLKGATDVLGGPANILKGATNVLGGPADVLKGATDVLGGADDLTELNGPSQ